VERVTGGEPIAMAAARFRRARRGRARTGLLSRDGLMLLPLVAALGVVFGYPLVRVIRLSLFRDNIFQAKFVGLENYRYLLVDDPNFWPSLAHNALLLLGIPIMLALALVVAFLIHDGVRSTRLSAVYRALVFLPFVLSIVVVGRIFTVLLRSDGPLNGFAGALGWGLDTAWLGDSSWALPSVLSVIVWREFGLGVILFLARLSTVPEELFEAARVEGASWWQTLRHVAIPQLYSTIAFWTLLNVIVMFSWVFNYVYVLTRGGPGNATSVVELQIYAGATSRDQPNIAAALATMLLLLVVAFILGQAVLRKRLLRGVTS
jgi:ABC-type sugar transport system permease subunit